MKKHISFNKKSKKEQKRINAEKRGNWGDIKPVTIAIPNKKKYNRKGRHKNCDGFSIAC